MPSLSRASSTIGRSLAWCAISMSLCMGLHFRCGQLGVAARHLDVSVVRQRDAHPSLDEAFGFAEQTNLGAGNAQSLIDAIEDDALGLHAAVDHGARSRALQRGVDW